MINPFESHTVLSLQEEAVEPTPECVDEFPALYDELTDDIIKEAISDLLAAEDEQLNATCELDKLDKATEEEAQ